MVGAPVFSPVRLALLPAAARDTHLSLSRVNSLMEMGASVAAVAGMVLALSLRECLWPARAAVLDDPEASTRVLMALVIANVICVLPAFPVSFPSSIPRPELANRALQVVFHDCRRIW